MRFIILTILCILLAFCPLIGSDSITPIGQLHTNNSEGYPAEPFSIGTTVSVSGVVTFGSGVLSATHTEAFLEDSTGGILIYDPNTLHSLQRGDRVTISGTIEHLMGATAMMPAQIEYHGKGTEPSPIILNCSNIRDAFEYDYREPNESRLVQLRNVKGRNTSPYWTLFDSTGSCKMYLYPDFDLADPGSEFSVTGILWQRDESTPFTDDYVIMPRAIADFSSKEPPKFVIPLHEIQITPNEVSLEWATDTEATAVVRYGKTTVHEIGEIELNVPANAQQVRISGLQPATYYHCQAFITNDYGTSASSDLLFCTGSRPESTGEINVYFNHSVDNSIATYQNAEGYVNLKNKLKDRLSTARYSIDMCIYSLTLGEIVSELIAAYQRGVSVRVICENENTSDEVSRLINSGVPLINDAYGDNSGDSYMHNKFVIIDHRDSLSAADDWVWTGSYNFSYNATYRNAENVIEIQDEALAKCFTTEFNEMWGSPDETPDPQKSRFSYRKSNNTPHTFFINGVEIHPYFSPADKIAYQLELALRDADYSCYFCIYSFTQSGLAQRMHDRMELYPYFRLSGVFDCGQPSSPNSQWSTMASWEPPADIWVANLNSGGILHHKYLILDGDHPQSDPVVVTGSYNWSSSAESYNDENSLFIAHAKFANLYYQEFNARYTEAGGTAVPRLPQDTPESQVPQDITLYQNYPNPFNGATEIRFFVARQQTRTHVTIHNISGQRIKTLHDGRLEPGIHQMQWQGDSDNGQPVSSGVYFIKLRGNAVQQFRKMILIH
ncbi:T9SS type A sorting domain-containing protein [candidate division KSB1 bacterium]|nr:T9SS type A sorting domain-containing protein [candidate division KSB1 bacterium]